jgi:hypothetical protein
MFSGDQAQSHCRGRHDTPLRKTIVARFVRTLLAALASIIVLAPAALAQTTVTLMQGTNAYTGTSDSWINAAAPTTNQNSTDALSIRSESTDATVIRFAIFAREGGPVPDNATITAATLSLYKFFGPSATVKASRLLKSFNATQVTWNSAATGAAWTTAGALSAGNDYLAAADGQASIGDATADACTSGPPFPEACWLRINVLSSVQAFAGGASNFGWKIAEVSSGQPGQYKNFNSSKNTFFPALRPQLTLTYTVPAGIPITLMEGSNGYAGTRDTWIKNTQPTTVQDSSDGLSIRAESTDATLLRFAIFAREGGPVPDNATITSARLMLYHYFGPSATVKASRLLKSFDPLQATWNLAASGSSWTTAGALSAGNDYLAAADGQASIGDATADGCTSSPFPQVCWLNINVLSGVQAFAGGAPNLGWKIAEVSSSQPTAYKNFNSSKNTFFPQLRPQLALTYTVPTVTLMQGSNSYAGTTDTWIKNTQPTTVQDSSDGLSIRAESTDAAVLRFAIFAREGGPVPDDATITAATLSLYHYFGPSATVKASRLLKSFDPLQATWNVAATGTPWTTAGALSSGNDYLATPDGQGSIGDATADGCTSSPFPQVCWLRIDVLAGVQAFAGGAPNFGWKIAEVSSGQPTAYKNFNSSKNGFFPQLRPQLAITYEGGTPPAPQPPTPNLAANPQSGTTGVTVVFDASASQDNGAPITSLTLEFGDGTNVTWADKTQTQAHQYPVAGDFTARLTATNSAGTSPVPATKTIHVTAPQGQEFPPTAGLTQVATGTGPGSGEARPTFHSMSLYFNPLSAPSGNQVFVRYRKATEDPSVPGMLKQGWPLWYDARPTTTGWGPLPYVFKARGSVVYLTPGTKYFFELGTGSSYETASWTHYMEGTTRSETVPEDPAVTTIPTQSATFVITAGGTANAYKVYDGWNGTGKNEVNRGGAGGAEPAADWINTATIGSWSDASFAIVVKASFVIVRRVIIKGARAAAIVIYPNVTDVIIEDCEITDWSWRPGHREAWQPPNPITVDNWGTWGGTQSGGINLVGNNSRIVIQRNKIFDPHFGGFPWERFGCPNNAECHPEGPSAIFIADGGRQNVIRYNEIYSTDLSRKRWFNDAIGGGENFSDKGSPGSDSDIYHNIIRNAYDDAVEAEGGGLNVRIWGNYTDHSMTGIATTITHLGPMYVFRNVINRLRRYQTVKTNSEGVGNPNLAEPDDDLWGRGVAFKASGSAANGDGIRWGGGRKYFFHNTLLQQPKSTFNPAQTFADLGANAGIDPAHDPATQDRSVLQTWTRNNILDVFRPAADSFSVRAGSINTGDLAQNNNFDYDLTSGNVPSTQPHGVPNTRPSFKANHGWMGFPRLTAEPNGPPETVDGSGVGVGSGNFQLNTGTAGVNVGSPLPNFNSDIDNVALARKSGVAVGASGPDMGAHDSEATDPMLFGLPAAQ